MALVGIARMAAQSTLLEAKRQVEYLEMPARSILNRSKPGMPFQWTINPYRGCEFGCKYCYARYTFEFMELPVTDFEDRIFAKSASAHLLAQELRRIDRREQIAIGTSTDPCNIRPSARRSAMRLIRGSIEGSTTTRTRCDTSSTVSSATRSSPSGVTLPSTAANARLNCALILVAMLLENGPAQSIPG